MFDLLHNDVFLKIASGLVGAATIVATNAPEHTIAFKASNLVLGFGALLGIYSTTGREPK